MAEYEPIFPLSYTTAGVQVWWLRSYINTSKREGMERIIQIDEGQQISSGTCSKTGLNLNAFGVTAPSGVETVHSVPCQNNPCTLEIASGAERTTITITTQYGHGLLLASIAKLPVWVCCSRMLCCAHELVNSSGLVSMSPSCLILSFQ